MRVGFDAKRATMNFTGLGNYSRSILLNLGKFFPENSYILYTPRLINPDRYSELTQGIPFKITKPRLFFSRGLAWFWRSFMVGGLIRKDQIDVFHGLSGELPYGYKNGNTRYILTVHDLIFYRYPEFYKPLDRIFYKWKLKYACRKSDEIIAISGQTKSDLIQYLSLEPSKISIIYQSCHERFYEKTGSEKKREIRRDYALPSRYILCVGTLEPRKRALSLLKAFYSMQKHTAEQPELNEIELVFIGKKTEYFTELESFIQAYSLENKVHFRQDVPLDDLPAIYQLAEIMAYPSTFEGFGLPILEALVSGVPVITSVGSCFQEAGGPDSIYVDPEDTPYFCEKLIEVLSSSEIKQFMRIQGWEYAENFKAEKVTGTLMERYKKLID